MTYGAENMQKILRKRTLRELKEHFFRYLTLGMLIAVAVFMIVALYAMGVKRQELMQHYILLPTLVSFVSGVVLF